MYGEESKSTILHEFKATARKKKFQTELEVSKYIKELVPPGFYPFSKVLLIYRFYTCK
jgi:hypothetical protein